MLGFSSTKRRNLYERHFIKCAEKDPLPKDFEDARSYCKSQFKATLTSETIDELQHMMLPPRRGRRRAVPWTAGDIPAAAQGAHKEEGENVHASPGSHYSNLLGEPASPSVYPGSSHVNEPASGPSYNARFPRVRPQSPTANLHPQSLPQYSARESTSAGDPVQNTGAHSVQSDTAILDDPVKAPLKHHYPLSAFSVRFGSPAPKR
jgi:hypothetical protein